MAGALDGSAYAWAGMVGGKGRRERTVTWVMEGSERAKRRASRPAASRRVVSTAYSTDMPIHIPTPVAPVRSSFIFDVGKCANVRV